VKQRAPLIVVLRAIALTLAQNLRAHDLTERAFLKRSDVAEFSTASRANDSQNEPQAKQVRLATTRFEFPISH
jgi:hypothetical protein